MSEQNSSYWKASLGVNEIYLHLGGNLVSSLLHGKNKNPLSKVLGDCP